LEGEYNIPKAANARSVRDFDEGLTRVSFGFKSVDDYYSNSSSSDSIKNVSIPLLCIQADNDPIAPSRGIPREDIKVFACCSLYFVVCTLLDPITQR
jgi:predicted alpha/beta-fold hydrolase